MLDIARRKRERAARRRSDRAPAGDEDGRAPRFSVEAGAIARRRGRPPRAALAPYGAALGAAFQIADDLLDAEGDDGDAGQARRQGRRAPQGDAGRRARTGRARAELAALVSEAKAAVDAAGVGAAGDALRAAADFVAMRKS